MAVGAGAVFAQQIALFYSSKRLDASRLDRLYNWNV
jgi:hypothetical protein